MIKAIGFDLGGVYLTDCWNRGIREKIAQKFHISQDGLETKSNIFTKQMAEGKLSEDEFLNKIINGPHVDLQEVKDYIRQSNRVISPQLYALIENLKGKYTLVLMNNEGKEWNKFRIRRFNLDKLVDKVQTSCVLGARKPKKE